MADDRVPPAGRLAADPDPGRLRRLPRPRVASHGHVALPAEEIACAVPRLFDLDPNSAAPPAPDSGPLLGVPSRAAPTQMVAQTAAQMAAPGRELAPVLTLGPAAGPWGPASDPELQEARAAALVAALAGLAHGVEQLGPAAAIGLDGAPPEALARLLAELWPGRQRLTLAEPGPMAGGMPGRLCRAEVGSLAAGDLAEAALQALRRVGRAAGLAAAGPAPEHAPGQAAGRAAGDSGQPGGSGPGPENAQGTEGGAGPAPAWAGTPGETTAAEAAANGEAGRTRLLLWSSASAARLGGAEALLAGLAARGFQVLHCDRGDPAVRLAAIAQAADLVVPDLACGWEALFAAKGARLFVLLPGGGDLAARLRPWRVLAAAAGLQMTAVLGPPAYRRLRHRLQTRLQRPRDRAAAPPVYALDPGLVLPFFPPPPEAMSDWPLPQVLEALYRAAAEADVLTGAWAVWAEPTPPWFTARLRALRLAAVRGIARAPGGGLADLARHPFFADFSRSLRSGLPVLAELAAEEAALARQITAAFADPAPPGPLEPAALAGEAGGWRRLLLAMLLVPAHAVPPLPLSGAGAALGGAATSPDLLEHHLRWAMAPPALIRDGEDAAWLGHAERLLAALAELLEGDLPPRLRARLTRMAGRIDLGQLLLIAPPLGGVTRARNRLLALVAEGGQAPLSAQPLGRVARWQERAAFYHERLRLARARHSGTGAGLWLGLAARGGQRLRGWLLHRGYQWLARGRRLRPAAPPGEEGGAETLSGSAPPVSVAPLPAPPVPAAPGHGPVDRRAALPPPEGPPGAGRRLRLGVLCRTFEKGPDSEAVLCTLQGFEPERFELFAYSVGMRDRVAHLDADFEQLFAQVVPTRRLLPADPAALRAQLLEDRLDVFLYANATTYGVQPLDLALYHRVAPLQLVLNSHVPMPMGYPSFDALLTGRSDRPAIELDPADFPEQLVQLPGPVINYLTSLQPRPDPPLDRASLGFGPQDVVMLNAGSSMKLRHATLKLMMQAVAAVPGGILLLAPYNPGWAARSMAFVFNRQLAETAAEVGLDPARIRVLGELSVAEAEAALAAADLYLNPFPHGGATMTHLALLHGVPPVTLRRRTPRAIDQFLIESHGFAELLADSPAAYLELAVRLGRDAPWRAALRARLRQAAAQPGFVADPAHGRRQRDAVLALWLARGGAGPG